MLENESGKRLPGICNGEHWQVLRELLQEAPLWDPFRQAIEAHVNAAVATHGNGGPGHQVTIDSTAAGPSIFGTIAADWETNYRRWLADLHQSKLNVPDQVEARQVEGMAIWYVLAELRPDERWLAPPYQKLPRIYKLLGVPRKASCSPVTGS